MKKLGSNTCESIHNNQKEQAEDSSYPKSIDIMLRETARKSYPENVDSPMIAPRDYEVRQSGRALELQNRDYWIRPTDLSWHYPIVVTIRAVPFKKYRGRSIAILEARDEAKKQKTQKNSLRVTSLLAVKSST